jgi:hypothetical protein
MATTTNYSWTTPDDTSLVKDGAAAIRSLGTSIDTTTKALNPSTTLGDIEYRSSSANANTRLAIGTTGQVLTVNGGVPSWATVSAGGMTLIASINASAATSLSFTGIPSTYKHLMITVVGNQDTTNQGWGLRLNNDSGNNYSQDGIFYQGPTTPEFQITNNVNTSGFGLSTSSQRGVILAYQGASYGDSTSEIWIFDYADAANQKAVRWNARGSRESGGGAYAAFCHHQGVYENLVAVNRVDFIRSSSQTFTGIIRLYGVS